MVPRSALKRTIAMTSSRQRAEASRGSAADDGVSLRQVAGGDEAGLKRLYELQADAFNGLALRLLQNPPEAQEAVQDAYIRIWRSAATWDEEKSAAFTRMVMLQRRACIDRLRARGRHECHSSLRIFRD